ncbi:hypothetical protein ANN_10067 [Periplaneta americana]|uniref:Uncharacterized protein n=1 Tax=Periplaneta americana TaxID=6978 RepID=A0ABQ8TQP9_PERAM|nr:hypothetical protein ANN_10067 [Periplaneta americana]
MAGLCEGGSEPPGSLKATSSDRWHLFAIHVPESAASSTRKPLRHRFHDSPKRHLSKGATLARSNTSPLIEAPVASLRYVQLPQTDIICRRILEPRPPCPHDQPVTIKDD